MSIAFWLGIDTRSGQQILNADKNYMLENEYENGSREIYLGLQE